MTTIMTMTVPDPYATTDPLAHLGLIGDVVNAYEGRARSLTRDDLFQEGFLGLLRAKRLFDPGRGVKFSTFATHCIRTEIFRAIVMYGPLIYVPRDVQSRLKKRRPDDPATESCHDGKGRHALRGMVPVDPRTMAEPEKDGPADGPDPEELDWLRRSLGRLTPAMRRALVLRYGLDGGEPASYPAVGRQCGISKQAAQDAARRGMWRLRKLKMKEAGR